jgi:hypothetical protein
MEQEGWKLPVVATFTFSRCGARGRRGSFRRRAGQLDVLNAWELRGLLEALYILSQGVRPWYLSSSVLALCSFFFATLAMEHGDSSRGSHLSAMGEGDGAPSHHHRLNPGIASSSGYGQAQNTTAWGVPTPLQEAWEELATVKAVVTSLEEEAALARSQ